MINEFRRVSTLKGIPTPFAGTALTTDWLVERLSALGADYRALEQGAPILAIQKDPLDPSSFPPKSIMAFAVKPPDVPGFQMVTERGFEFPVGCHVVIGSKGMIVKTEGPIILLKGWNVFAPEVFFGEKAILARVKGTDLALPVICMAKGIGFEFARNDHGNAR